MRSLLPVLLLVAAAAWPRLSAAQLPDSLAGDSRITIVTMVPGDRVYNRYGHTAIRVQDRRYGFDLAFNYGTFDFEEPGFLGKFVYGATDYFLSYSSFRLGIRAARSQERAIIEQELTLDRKQRIALYALLRENALPENATYRYRFLLDNCSTRPRDMLERVTGQGLNWPQPAAHPPTYRQLLNAYTASAPWLETGINLVVGAPADAPVGPRESTFLPLELMERLDAATISDSLGVRPLVSKRDTVFWYGKEGLPDRSFPWPALLGWLIALAGLLPVYRSRSAPRKDLTTGDRVLLGVLGTVGLFMLGMATLTVHDVTSPNWNLLWALPTHLVIALIGNRLPRRWLGGYLAVSAVLAAVSLAGGWLLPQPVPGALVPIVLLAVVRFVWHARTMLRTRD